MTDKLTNAFKDVSRLITAPVQAALGPRYIEEQPLRAELFSIEQLEQHAISLAGWNEIDPKSSKDKLLPRLAENERMLIKTYELLAAAVDEKRRIAPAGEWLLDNFYLIEEQIRTSRKHFPVGYSRELPCLLNGPLSGFPRVYELALELVSHGDGKVDSKSLCSFVTAYQTVAKLRIGELWAIPIMLRLALIENLRRVASRIAYGRNARDIANYWADKIIEVAEKEPNDLILVMADMVRAKTPMIAAFVAEFARRLQGQSSALALPLSWLEQRLVEQATDIEHMVQAESQQQAADQVSIGNTIGSLRFLSMMDWREFVESMSGVENILKTDPSGAYPLMDFKTRDRYRHVVENISKRSAKTEAEVAAKAIELSVRRASRFGSRARSAHVGYFLVDEGLGELEKTFKVRPLLRNILRRIVQRFPLFFYLGPIAFFTALVTVAGLSREYAMGARYWLLWLLGVLLFVASSRFAVAVTNWVITLAISPEPLSRMNFSSGIPSDKRTIVVVPSMIKDKTGIDSLVDGLEVRYLANRDENLLFGLLTDFYDAPQETLPGDADALSYARKKIEELNRKYASRGDIFFLFHRARLWNAEEGVWMAYERKRGKLAELNKLLRERVFDGKGYVVAGDVSLLEGIKYVIVLDSDTHIPLDAARKLVATMAHPLNAAEYDGKKGRVTEGYGILQPRVSVNIAGVGRSWFVKIFGDEPGIDPYTLAVSDVYQDLFGEGSFVGKGIYDIDAFSRALDGRFPDNLILSHDLLEGCYARTGLVSDVELFEEYPSSYISDVNRRHRWIRGDWQIAAWLFPKVPSYSGKWVHNPLSLSSKWKILDNLRRSLVPAAMMLLLAAGWIFTHDPWFWTIFGVGMMVIPQIAVSAREFLVKSKDMLFVEHLRSCVFSAVKRLAQAVFLIFTLPYDAFFSLDAMIRALTRSLITRRKMLEWVTSSDMKRLQHASLAGFYGSMWIAPAVSIILAVTIMYVRPGSMDGALVLVIPWALSPILAWWVSQTRPEKKEKLTPKEEVFLRTCARKTWRFFAEFAGADNNWLPVDNYQETPVSAVARRTSPTNIGMALLSTLAAHDFRYISGTQLLERIGHTFRTMEKMERYRGNFYNWYDTQTLKPLEPLYVSTVDSGNLAGAAVVLRQGLVSFGDTPVVPENVLEGVKDTATILLDSIKRSGNAPQEAKNTAGEILEILSSGGRTAAGIRETLNRAASLAAVIGVCGWSDKKGEVGWWALDLERHCAAWIAEIDRFMPWAGPACLKLNGTVLAKLPMFKGIPTFRDLSLAGEKFSDEIDLARSSPEGLELAALVKAAAVKASEALACSGKLAAECGLLADMEFDLLFDKANNLLTIGYSVSERKPDQGYYDLLASESRLASFIGIAFGRLPQEHWFAMGRQLTTFKGDSVLLSWSGSMFEYLMPLLIMPSYENTLLHGTYRSAVRGQIAYASQRGIPWGISESGYNTTDAQMNYQYRAFGVPELGFKRGLSDDLVIAPYASALALMVETKKACANLSIMEEEGFSGRYGFYEAVDYTPSRLPHGESRSAVVRSFMAHHQGMSFLALAYSLLNKPMQRRFLADPAMAAAEVLLQERVPKGLPFHPHSSETYALIKAPGERESLFRVFNTPNTPIPEVHFLSNGRYTVLVTNSGGGHSRWNDIAVTRWQEDTTRDNCGMFFYLRDVFSGETWSVGYHPTRKLPRRYEAIFSQGKAEFRRTDKDINTHAEFAVSPEDDIELRRVRLTNRSRVRRVLEITSYAEVVLAAEAADALHPAFSKLFVSTEIIKAKQAIICQRRKRSKEDPLLQMFHLVAIHGNTDGEVSYETDRAQFLGRCNTPSEAEEMKRSSRLSGSQGSVLDPIVSLRSRIVLDPDETATVDFVTGMADKREKVIELIDKYRDKNLADRVFDLAWTHGQVVLQHFNATEADAQLFGRLASSIVYPSYFRRAGAALIAKNSRGQSGLWGYSISGDLPIALLRISDQANIDLVRQMLKAHAYWRMKGLKVDLLIWNEDVSGYRQNLQDKIMGIVTSGTEAHLVDRPGGIFVRRLDQVPEEDRLLMLSSARLVISDTRGTLDEQVDRRGHKELNIPKLEPGRQASSHPGPLKIAPRRDLVFYNGIGGFTRDGREYVITVVPGALNTPAPWVNVLANPEFGSVVGESGCCYTWSENAGLFRLTPWNNDPVSGISGEAFYIRDEETGKFWSPAPLPVPGSMHYVVRHGFGYTVFEHEENGIETELWVYVSHDASIKYMVLKVKNSSGRARRLSATAYFEPVMGESRQKTQMHVTTEVDPITGALLIRNRYNVDFAGRVMFVDSNLPGRTVTGDRTEFIGRNGALSRPAAMGRVRLSNKVGAGLDPCAALQSQLELADGQTEEIVFILGAGKSIEEARALVTAGRGSGSARQALENLWGYWNRALGAVNVETPDGSVNFLTNGWLLYQTLACRMWAKSGFYQSGGAFGFRDQLQDAMALVHCEPGILKEQIILAASRQFKEGDVQHWWHPPSGAGVRTRISDDYLWLPLAVARYVKATGDAGVLEEKVRFIEGRAIKGDEDAYYDKPVRSDDAASVYDHCLKALSRAISRIGEHGIPLMGTGDWNDGMNLVGNGGKGESVWLGFFLFYVLNEFREVCLKTGDAAFAGECSRAAGSLKANIEHHAWDGEWYMRAFFDDGRPLGSDACQECQIDSIPQSWAVISRAGDLLRARAAVEEADRRLVMRKEAIVRLFTPPFDLSDAEPGYIKGYVPGVRENGGQYTHAAVWLVMAFVMLGDAKKAWELFEYINPIKHGSSAREISVYKVEPYVSAADVYTAEQHIGRGGWTWYTGSAGWMYRLLLEYFLGIRLEAGRLRFEPCIPDKWNSFTAHYRFMETTYHIVFERTGPGSKVISVELDGDRQEDRMISLANDRAEHTARVLLG